MMVMVVMVVVMMMMVMLCTVVHLLEMLLMFNPAERLTVDEALSHVYFADCQHLSDTDATARRPSGSSVVCTHIYNH